MRTLWRSWLPRWGDIPTERVDEESERETEKEREAKI